MDTTARISLRGSAIMVVEDEFFQADGLARALAEAGAKLVGPFATVEPALASLAQADHIDAAVLDVNLRGVTVSPVTEALAARDIPFMFATGYHRDMLPPAWREVPVLEKPFSIDKLVEMVSSLCRGRTDDHSRRDELPDS